MRSSLTAFIIVVFMMQAGVSTRIKTHKHGFSEFLRVLSSISPLLCTRLRHHILMDLITWALTVRGRIV